MIEVLIVSVPFYILLLHISQPYCLLGEGVGKRYGRSGGGKQEGRGGSVFLYLFLYYQYMGCQCVN